MRRDKVKQYLRWYFNDSAAVLGMRSNYYTILNTAYGQIPYTENDSLLGSLKKIGDHRKIHQALMSLDRCQIRYLNALYLDEYQSKYPKIIKNVFNEKTGLALCLFYDMEMLLDLCTKFRHQSLSSQEEIELNKLMELTETTYQKLHKQLTYNHYIMELSQ